MDLKNSAINYLSHLNARGIRYIKSAEPVKEIKKEIISKPIPSINNAKVSTVNNLKTVDCSNIKSLEEIRACIGDCKRCRLSEARTNIVFGEGNTNADLMFVGEGPGQDEDQTGRPFVGRAGQLLTKIIEAMKLKREDVYIANIVKCRPPGNRTPVDDEIMTCSPFLMSQIKMIKPKVIVSLGSPSTCTLLNEKIKITAIRGTFYDWKDGIKLMPTFHPAYLLRNYSEENRRSVWSDMQKVMAFLDQGREL